MILSSSNPNNGESRLWNHPYAFPSLPSISLPQPYLHHPSPYSHPPFSFHRFNSTTPQCSWYILPCSYCCCFYFYLFFYYCHVRRMYMCLCLAQMIGTLSLYIYIYVWVRVRTHARWISSRQATNRNWERKRRKIVYILCSVFHQIIFSECLVLRWEKLIFNELILLELNVEWFRLKSNKP